QLTFSAAAMAAAQRCFDRTSTRFMPIAAPRASKADLFSLAPGPSGSGARPPSTYMRATAEAFEVALVYCTDCCSFGSDLDSHHSTHRGGSVGRVWGECTVRSG